MSGCEKCGSNKAYWSIKEKDGNSQKYCDDCFQKYDLSDHKKKMEEYHKQKKMEENKKIADIEQKKKESENKVSKEIEKNESHNAPPQILYKKWLYKMGIPMVVIGLISFAKDPDAIIPVKIFLGFIIFIGLGLSLANFFIPKTIKEQAGEWYERGLLHGIKKEYMTAIKCFDHALSLYPEHLDAMAMKGGMFLDNGQTAEALKCLEVVLTKNPNHKSAINIKKAAEKSAK